MYFQLEVDYYSNEANKNKYTNFQLKASIKNNVKIAEDQIILDRELVILCCSDLKVLCCLDFLLVGSVFFKCKLFFFELGISCSIFISIRYT